MRSHRTHRARPWLLAVLIALALVAAACGDDDEVAPTGDASGQDAASDDGSGGGEEATGTTVKIGVLHGETGRTAGTYNTVDDVARAWADWVNSEMGGVGGHVVEIVPADTEGTGEAAAAAARELIAEDVVGVIIEDVNAEPATVDLLADAGIPYIGGTANSRPLELRGDEPWPNTHFVTAPSPPGVAAAALLAAESTEHKVLAAAVCAEVPACAEVRQLLSIVAEDLPVEFAGVVTVGAADPSYTAQCLELIDQGADVVSLGLTSDAALRLIEECDLQGYEGSWSASVNTVVASDFEEVEGLRLIGGINGFPWWADAEPVQTYRDITEGAGIDARNPSATTTWSALELFRKAMEDSGPPADAEVTTADVVAAYHQVEGETLDGLLPKPLTFVEEGPQPYINCLWLFSMEDGEFSTVTSGESGNGASGDLQTSCSDFGVPE